MLIDVKENDLASSTLVARTYCESSRGRFAACLSIGPLSPGHSMVFPKFAASSIAAATVRQDYSSELQQFVGHLTGMLSGVFSLPVFQFEHGTASNSNYRGATSHAELHVIPSPLVAADMTGLDTYSWAVYRDMSFLRAIVSGGADYLYIRDGHGAARFRAVGDHELMPLQYLRSLFWEGTRNSESFDWQKDEDPHRHIQAATMLRQKARQYGF